MAASAKAGLWAKAPASTRNSPIKELVPGKAKEDSEKKLLCEYSDGAEKNQPYIVRLAVNQAKTEVLQVDVLYFANTKTEPANGIKKEPTGSLSPEITELPATLTGSTISISSY